MENIRIDIDYRACSDIKQYIRTVYNQGLIKTYCNDFVSLKKVVSFNNYSTKEYGYVDKTLKVFSWYLVLGQEKVLSAYEVAFSSVDGRRHYVWFKSEEDAENFLDVLRNLNWLNL